VRSAELPDVLLSHLLTVPSFTVAVGSSLGGMLVAVLEQEQHVVAFLVVCLPCVEGRPSRRPPRKTRLMVVLVLVLLYVLPRFRASIDRSSNARGCPPSVLAVAVSVSTSCSDASLSS